MVQLVSSSLVSLFIAVSIEVFNVVNGFAVVVVVFNVVNGFAVVVVEEFAGINVELTVTLLQIVSLTKNVSLNSVLMGGHCMTGLQQSPQS